MRFVSFALVTLLSTGVLSNTPNELVIVGIDHALDMEARRGSPERQVYLSERSPAGLTIPVGTEITVHRFMSERGQETGSGGAHVSIPSGLLRPTSDHSDSAGTALTVLGEDTLTIDVPIKLEPAPKENSGGHKGSMNDRASKDETRTRGNDSEDADGHLNAQRVERQVGRLEVIGYRDGIWVAKILHEEPNLGSDTGSLKVGGSSSNPGVQVGDEARILRVRTAVKEKVVEVPQTHRAQLIKERDQLLLQMRSRGRSTEPYKRKLNRWDL